MDEPSPDYDRRYSEWKSWDQASFGRLTADAKRYFDGETRRVGVGLPAGAQILEIGFGHGSFLAYARLRGWSVSGTELNGALADAAERQEFEVHRTGDLVPFPDDSFDAVFAFDVVEHVAAGDLVTFFEDVRRVCKPGALFVFRVPNGDSPFGLINQNGDITHVSAIGRHKIDYVARNCHSLMKYYGGEYVPIRDPNLRVTILRALGAPIRRVMNFIVQCVMFPEMRIAYFSRNAVYALRMK